MQHKIKDQKIMPLLQLITSLCITSLALVSIFGVDLQQVSQAESGIQEAKIYQHNSQLQWNWAIESVEKIAFKGNETILDIGCGDGKISAYLLQKAPEGHVHGVDLSQKMIHLAQSLFPPISSPRITFAVGDAISLQQSNCFDIVTSFCCFHWIEDQRNALLAAINSLAPGGKLLIVTPEKMETSLSLCAEAVVSQERWTQYFPNFKPKRFYFTKEEYEALLNELGIKNASVKSYACQQEYPNRQAFIAWITPLVTFASHLSPELRGQFLNDLADEMLKTSLCKEDGSLLFPSKKLEIYWEKESS